MARTDFRGLKMDRKAGMMQPYLFPYLGYFQLIAAVDVFVLGDDLQYVKESWINRNRILMGGKDRLISFPLKKHSHLSKINERFFSDDFSGEMERLVRVLSNAYAKAPCYKKVFPFLEEMIRFPEPNLAKYAEYAIRQICNYLDIGTPIVIASQLPVGPVEDKQDRVIKTARLLDANVYVNLSGGKDLYDADYFREHGMRLQFHRMDAITYRQFGQEFVPLLSIIDVLMFNEVPQVQRMLPRYTLEEAMCHSMQ